MAVFLSPYQGQPTGRRLYSSQDRIALTCHLSLLLPPPSLGPELHRLVSHSIFFSSGGIFCPTSLSGLACSATPFLNQAVSSQWNSLCSSVKHLCAQICPYRCVILTDLQNYFTLKYLLAASLVHNTFNQKAKGKGREEEGIYSQNEAQ